MLAAAFIKGSVGFGFPTLATPLLALVMDVKTAVALLVVPNLVMDGFQARRRGALGPAVRRMAPLVLSGAAGTLIGTRLLMVLSPRAATAVLGGFLVVFVAVTVARLAPSIPPGHEPWLSPVVGFVAGVVGGVTNVPGTPLVLYFYALGMAKDEFVRSVAVTFVAFKLVQLAALVWYGLIGWRLLGMSVGVSAVAMAGFTLGLRVQDRLDQATFNRAVLGFLLALGVWLLVRAW